MNRWAHNPGFFDVDHRMKRLSDLGDQLEAFGSAVDFEIFRGDLVLALAYSENGQGGRPPSDPVMMFKILVIQAANNLSEERTEFLINKTRRPSLPLPECQRCRNGRASGSRWTGRARSTNQALQSRCGERVVR